jgi:Ca-activated chloride channel homolog
MAAESHASRFAPFFLSVGLVLVICCLCAWAQFSHQEPASQPTAQGPSLPAIFISAHNKDGTPAGVSAPDLEIKINGKQVAVADVQPLGRPPLRYCLVFDSSGSRRARWSQQQDAATALLKIAQPGRDYGMLVAFSDQPYLDAEGTDPQKLIRALSKESARGATALYDAMIACSDSMSKSASKSDLQVMFVLSDGDDNASHLSREEVLRTLVRDGIRVYAIAQENAADPSQRAAAKGTEALKQCAEKTGRKAYFPESARDDETAIGNISSDLGSVFSVTVSSTQSLAGDLFYKLEFKCHKKDVSLSAPREYFVPLP